MKKVIFTEAVADITGGNRKFQSDQYLSEGAIAVVDQGRNLVAGYVNDIKSKVSTSGPVIVFGDHTRIFKYVDFPFVLGADGVKVLVPKIPIYEKYLYYYFLTANIPNTGYSRHFKHLKKLLIPLPSLDEQRRIAALLDRADALRQKDRQLLAHYDQLAQSLFLDLFGDPVRNEKGFKQVTIRDLVRDVKYGTSKPAEEGGTYPYLRMNNITYEGHWDFKDLKYINLAKNEEPKYLLKEGDLVFNRTNSKELVGKTAVYKRSEPMAIAGYLIRSRTNEKAMPEYISAYLNSQHGKAKLKGMCKNIIGMANINAQEFQDIEILQPPLPLQNHFATLIEQIEKQKAVVRQQMAASEALFGRLLQESFG